MKAVARGFRPGMWSPSITPPEVPARLTYLDLGNAWLQLVEPPEFRPNQIAMTRKLMMADVIGLTAS